MTGSPFGSVETADPPSSTAGGPGIPGVTRWPKLLRPSALRLAIAALIVGMVVQAAFVQWAAVHVRQDGRRVEASTRISAAYQMADTAVEDQQRAERYYLASHSTAALDDLMAASQRFGAALGDVQRAAGTDHADDV
ncbi:MAG: hypothetical protein QOJ19_3587, partial [Acidimicrobiia bacterium]|nr:hypothetical protein [Acidimicrobiia bacterium]